MASNCLTKDRKRFIAQLSRLQDSTERPYLFLEGSPSDLLNRGRPGANLAESGLAMDGLLDLLNQYNIPLLLCRARTVTERRAAGELVARLLISSVLH